jgi:hypothetical protein
MVFYIRSSIPWPSNNVSCGTGKSNTGIAAVCCDKRSAQMKEEGEGGEGRQESQGPISSPRFESVLP